MVDEFIRDRRDDAAEEWEYYARQPSLDDEAIDKAALATAPDGNMHDHQWRIPSRVLRKARRRLTAEAISGATGSDDRHSRIEEKILPITGIGALAV